MAIKEELLEETINEQCYIWLEKHGLIVKTDQDTEEGRQLHDTWNDWYNDNIYLPINQLVDEALTNWGYEELSADDIYHICDRFLSIEDSVKSLMSNCYSTGYGKGFKDGFEACDEQ